MPGFNDAHVHLGWAGEGMLSVRLYGAASIEELKKRLAAGVASHKPGEWITGAGWDHTLWPEKQFPKDRKSTRLNSSHLGISYAVFCLKKKKKARTHRGPSRRLYRPHTRIVWRD